MSAEDDELLEALGEALAPPPGGPPADRVAALRAYAAARQAPSEDVSAGTGPSAPAAPAVSAPTPESPPPSAPIELAPRRRRRDLLTGAVAAATGAALAVVGWEAFDADAQPGPPTEPVEVAVVPPDVAAEAVLINHTWGVEIILTATGLAADATFRSAIQPVDGGAEVVAGSFLGVEGVTVVCRMNASILRAAASSFTVVDEAGAPVITGTFA